MPNTTASGIVTPDEDDLDQPDVYLSAMADSIENGIGARLSRQELTAGAYMCIQTAMHFNGIQPGGNVSWLGFNLGTSECWVNGMTPNTDGSLTVITPGTYTVTVQTVASIGDSGDGQSYLETKIYRNLVGLGQNPVWHSGALWLSNTVSATFPCAANDQIRASVANYKGTGGDLNVNWPLFNTISVSMTSASNPQ